jgi:neutral ceramidase
MPLLAGASNVVIPVPAGVQLWGYPHVRRLATGTHDPLLASAIVLRRGAVTQVQIALDILMLEPPVARELRGRVAAALDTREELVFITCTHTHSGPVCGPIIGWAGDVAAPPPDPAVLDAIAKTAVTAARNAVSALQPAAVAWTTARVDGVGGNRHDPAGVTDPEAGVLAVRAADGTLLAVATVYGMHPTVLHEDSTRISSDFPHYARQALRARFGAKMVVAYHNGPCGNQSPRHHVTGQTFAEAERLGRRLGTCVAEALAALPDADFDPDPELAGKLRRFRPVRRRLPRLDAAERTLADYRKEYGRLRQEGAPRPDVRTAECAVFGAEGLVNLARAEERGDLRRLLSRYAPFEVQGLRVGRAGLVGLPGELFAEYGLEIKRAAPGRVFVTAFANGELQGYITTPEAVVSGGYEAAGAVFDCRTGAVMVRAARALLRDLGLASLRRATARKPV